MRSSTLVQVLDFDQYPNNINDLTTDGNASSFVALEEIKENLYYAKLTALPIAGQYILELNVRDPSGANEESLEAQKKTVIVTVQVNSLAKDLLKLSKCVVFNTV